MTAQGNPLLEAWTTPYGAPPFDRIRPEHFRPALDATMAEQKAAVERIAADPAEPTFDNTIVALERSGLPLGKVAAVFFNLAGADTNDAIQAIERDIAPLLSRHSERDLSERRAVRPRRRALAAARDALGLDRRAEARPRPLSHHLPARRRRARRGRQDAARRDQRAARDARHAVRPERARRREGARCWCSTARRDLAGLPDWRVGGRGRSGRRARPARQARRSPCRAPSIEPFLTSRPGATCARRPSRPGSPRGEIGRRQRQSRDHRRDRAAARRARRSSSATRPSPISASPTRWRRRRRRCSSFSRRCGRRPGAGRARGRGAAGPDRRGGRQSSPRRLGLALLRRKAPQGRFDFDEAELKPYLQLDKMIEAAFYTANRLFGLSFAERHDVPLYHPDVARLEGRRGRTARSSASSSAIISRGPRSAAAPG